MLEQRSIWLEGDLRPWAEVTVHVMSQSLQRGTLVFDFMPIYPGADGPRVFGLREHVARFVRSAGLNECRCAGGRRSSRRRCVRRCAPIRVATW